MLAIGCVLQFQYHFTMINEAGALVRTSANCSARLRPSATFFAMLAIAHMWSCCMHTIVSEM